MKNSRKLLCTVIALALLVLTAVPAFADVYVNVEPRTLNWGTTEKTTTYYTDSISISGLTKKSTITDVKSSKTSVVSINYISKYHSQNETSYFDPESKAKDESYSASIGLKIKKTGKATISFKVDGKAYKVQYTALGYENPVKNFQVTGISTKNLKSLYAKGNSAETSLSKDVKAGNIKVTAADGWLIKSIYWSEYKDYDSRQHYYGKGVNSVTMQIPSMSKSSGGYINITFLNKETQSNQTIYYMMRAASSNRR